MDFVNATARLRHSKPVVQVFCIAKRAPPSQETLNHFLLFTVEEWVEQPEHKPDPAKGA